MNENDKYVASVEQLSKEWIEGDEEGRGYILLATNAHLVGEGEAVHHTEGDADYIRTTGDKLKLSLALLNMLQKHSEFARIVLAAVDVLMNNVNATTLEELLQKIIINKAKNDCI